MRHVLINSWKSDSYNVTRLFLVVLYKLDIVDDYTTFCYMVDIIYSVDGLRDRYKTLNTEKSSEEK